MAWKQKWLVAGLWIVLTAITVAGIYQLPPVWRADAVVLVEGQKIPEKFVSSLVVPDLQDRLNTITQRILTTERLQKLIETYNLYPTERRKKPREVVIDQMRGEIKVNVVKGYSANRPGAFRVAFETADRNSVADVVNQIANFYIDENLKAREDQAEDTNEFLRSLLAGAKKTLDEQEARMSAYKIAHNGNLPQQEGALTGIVNRLQVQMQANQDALNRTHQNRLTVETTLNAALSTEEALVKMQKAASDATLAAADPSPGSSAPVLPSAPGKKRQSEILEDQLALLLERYNENHPDVVQMRANIARVKKIEEREEKAAAQWAALQSAAQSGKPVSPTAAAVPFDAASRGLAQERDRIAGLRAQLGAYKHEEEVRQRDHERILHELQDTQARLQALPIREQEMSALTRDYESAKLNYRDLYQKYYSSDMSTEMERRQKAERFAILERARRPNVPVKPDHKALSVIGAGIVLGLSLVIGVGREFKKNRVMGEWEIPEGVLILGRVPNVVLEAARGSGGPTLGPGRRAKLALVSSAVISVVATTLYFVLGT
jgi:uncharacterized protein involved in exopolysaccharide biosynthesis